MSKVASKRRFRRMRRADAAVRRHRRRIGRRTIRRRVAPLGYPLIVKPDCAGFEPRGRRWSNRPGDLAGAIDESRALRRDVPGRAVWCGDANSPWPMLDEQPLPLVEIVTPERVFSYEAKYPARSTEYRFDFRAGGRDAAEIVRAAVAAADALGTAGLARVDVMLDRRWPRVGVGSQYRARHDAAQPGAAGRPAGGTGHASTGRSAGSTMPGCRRRGLVASAEISREREETTTDADARRRDASRAARWRLVVGRGDRSCWSLGGGSYAVWQQVRGHVLASSRVSGRSRARSRSRPRPPGFTATSKPRCSATPRFDGPLSLVDGDLTVRMASAFAAHPWVAHVERVSKQYPSGLERRAVVSPAGGDGGSRRRHRRTAGRHRRRGAADARLFGRRRRRLSADRRDPHHSLRPGGQSLGRPGRDRRGADRRGAGR